MPPTIYNLHHAVHREKMAAFDYDWTLVSPKEGKTFPSNIDDWEWLYPSIPEKLKGYYEDGFMIVIFTNQSKAWKQDQIQLVLKSLNIPIFIVVATDKSEYKPNILLFNRLVDTNKINKDKSFFIGDALGRSSDFSDSDKVFAENIGIQWYCPEQVFRAKTEIIEIPTIPLVVEEQQIIIMMGFPGSGKSTIAKNICKTTNFVYIEGDIHKSSTKMIKASLEHISQKKSIVFDATNGSAKKRKDYIDLGRKHNYKIICIHVSTPLEIAYKRNKLRNYEKYVPKIAYSVYKKHYEPPNENEGFVLVVI
jgi:bifunctional polynucleotide phosphatase/kinase